MTASLLTLPRFDPSADEDETIAMATLHVLDDLHRLHLAAGHRAAVLTATALHAAALAFCQVEIGYDGVRRLLDSAAAENERKRARDAGMGTGR